LKAIENNLIFLNTTTQPNNRKDSFANGSERLGFSSVTTAHKIDRMGYITTLAKLKITCLHFTADDHHALLTPTWWRPC